MTPLPKKKHTHSRTLKRRKSIKLLLPNLSLCSACKKLKLPHIQCPYCGYHHSQAKS